MEPLTNYFAGRLQKDFNEGNTIIGGIITGTNRKIDNPDLNFLHNSAYTSGFDFSHSWKEKTYNFSLKTFFSQVSGDTESIIRTQRSSTRYFQRPDADHISLDSSRTSLAGHGGTIEVGKVGGGHLMYRAIFYWKSPGLELNDVGFIQNADEIVQVFWVGYRIWEPFSIFRNLNFNLSQYNAWDFGGTSLVHGGNINSNMQFKNYWNLSFRISPRGKSISQFTLRGGPSIKLPGNWSTFYSIRTDQRKKLQFGLTGNNRWDNNNSSRSQNYMFSIGFRPSNALDISLNPSISLNEQELQYVSTTNFGSETKYLFANIDQKTISISLRLNYNIKPNLTIQYWGQPFVSACKYFDFKRITSPMADKYTDRFHTFVMGEDINYNEGAESYAIDEDVDGTTDYYIENPDFNFKQFRSNLVARWEYIPGSTLYLVWSQGRTDFSESGDFNFNNDMQDLFDVHPYNIFLIKFSYRLKL